MSSGGLNKAKSHFFVNLFVSSEKFSVSIFFIFVFFPKINILHKTVEKNQFVEEKAFEIHSLSFVADTISKGQ